MAERLRIDDIFPIEIIIKETDKEDNLLPISSSHESNKRITFQITIDFDIHAFEIDGNEFSQEIEVPTENKDSDPVIFLLKAKKEGQHQINVKFYQKWQFIKRIPISVKVISESLKSNDEVIPHALYPSIPISSFPEASVTMFILEKSLESKNIYQVSLLLSLPSNHDYTIIPEPIKFRMDNPEYTCNSFFSELNGLSNRQDAHNLIMGEGRFYFRNFFPEELQFMYFQLRENIKSIRLISEEPYIPWEIARPWTQNISDTYYLCERYSFSRWITKRKNSNLNKVFETAKGIAWDPGEQKEVLSKRKFEKIVVVVPKNIDLIHAKEEAEWIDDFFKQKGINVIKVSKRDDFERVLKEPDIDLLHISTHGGHEKLASGQSYIQLEDNRFERRNFSGDVTRFASNNSVIIMNSCESSKQGISLTSIDSWARDFITFGASIFIGSLWKVDSEIALRFTQGLYTSLEEGNPIGEAVREARIKCRHHCSEKCDSQCVKREDPSWLSYQLYEHPNSTINLGPNR